MLVVKYVEPWARAHQQRYHAEALQMFGERVVVRHRWNIQDYAEGRVARCTSCSAGVRLNEQQRVRVLSASSGTFTLTFAGQETAAIPFDASAAEVQAALEALEVNTVGDVLVTGATQSIEDDGYIVEFRGQWASVETIPNMTYNQTSLNPSGTASLEVLQIRRGTGGASVQARVAAVYKQSGNSWCESCFGVGFEGGFEPLIYVTFALIGDQQQETTRTVGGVIQHEDPKVQFSFEPIVQEFDLVARVATWEADNITPRTVHGRFILREVQPTTLRTGPGTPDDSIALMPVELRTAYQFPNRDWVVGQTCGIEIVPFEHSWNLVPLTRQEERLVELGITENRKWFEAINATAPFDARETNP